MQWDTRRSKCSVKDILVRGAFSDTNLQVAENYRDEFECCDDRIEALVATEIDDPDDIAELRELIKESKEANKNAWSGNHEGPGL